MLKIYSAAPTGNSKKCVGFVLFGCFGNMCTCIYCVLYCLYRVFCIISFAFCLYLCKDYSHRVTTHLQLVVVVVVVVIIIIIIIIYGSFPWPRVVAAHDRKH
jgi:Na+/H+-dicarboxylate symporter